jgi:hypothetical protein
MRTVESLRKIKNQYNVLAGKYEKKSPVVGSMSTEKIILKRSQ